MNTASIKPNALELLTQHFATLGKKEITHAMIPFPMYVEPLTMEDHLSIKAAQEEKNPVRQAQRMAEFLVGKVKLEDGSAAFSSPKGMADAAQQLARKVAPGVVWELISQVASEQTTEAVSELEKKSEPETGA